MGSLVGKGGGGGQAAPAPAMQPMLNMNELLGIGSGPASPPNLLAAIIHRNFPQVAQAWRVEKMREANQGSGIYDADYDSHGDRVNAAAALWPTQAAADWKSGHGNIFSENQATARNEFSENQANARNEAVIAAQNKRAADDLMLRSQLAAMNGVGGGDANAISSWRKSIADQVGHIAGAAETTFGPDYAAVDREWNLPPGSAAQRISDYAMGKLNFPGSMPSGSSAPIAIPPLRQDEDGNFNWQERAAAMQGQGASAIPEAPPQPSANLREVPAASVPEPSPVAGASGQVGGLPTLPSGLLQRQGASAPANAVAEPPVAAPAAPASPARNPMQAGVAHDRGNAKRIAAMDKKGSIAPAEQVGGMVEKMRDAIPDGGDPAQAGEQAHEAHLQFLYSVLAFIRGQGSAFSPAGGRNEYSKYGDGEAIDRFLTKQGFTDKQIGYLLTSASMAK